MAQPPNGGGGGDDEDDRITRPFDPRPYDPVSDREKIRGRLAQILIWAVVVISLGTLIMLAVGRITVQDLPTVIGAMSPLVSVAAGVLGFYFGSEERRRS